MGFREDRRFSVKDGPGALRDGILEAFGIILVTRGPPFGRPLAPKSVFFGPCNAVCFRVDFRV